MWRTRAWTVRATAIAATLLLYSCSDSAGAPAAAPAPEAGTSPSPEKDAGADAALGSIGSLRTGTAYSIVYSAEGEIGVDARPTVSATFDDHGHLTAYEAGDQEK